VRKDHRPYIVKKAYRSFQAFFADHFLRPHFDRLGTGHTFFKPWHVELFGGPIEIGDYATVIATRDNRVRLSVWSEADGQGVRISSAAAVEIDDNCMLASNVYITDADWHDVYNRIAMGRTMPVRIQKNVWIGDSAIVCKGVTIGENSIIGAGAVVVQSIPANCIAAGNPARVVKHLQSDERFTTREQWFGDPQKLFRDVDRLDRHQLRGNSFLHWLRYLLFPLRGD
jgi:carbonic anhydrase/acetyltransferase-like protein (isoleucine patch superfamily)